MQKTFLIKKANIFFGISKEKQKVICSHHRTSMNKKQFAFYFKPTTTKQYDETLFPLIMCVCGLIIKFWDDLRIISFYIEAVEVSNNDIGGVIW